jgi:acyl carrier protein
MTDFEIELRDKLIKQLGLEDIDSESISADTFLFGEGQGLELDSVDAIEIEVLVKTDYGIEILASERNKTTFGTFGNLAAFVQNNLNRDA